MTTIPAPPPTPSQPGADDLEDRVQKFQALQLPGQPMGMHMGTVYLVRDLWREVERLRARLRDDVPPPTPKLGF